MSVEKSKTPNELIKSGFATSKGSQVYTRYQTSFGEASQTEEIWDFNGKEITKTRCKFEGTKLVEKSISNFHKNTGTLRLKKAIKKSRVGGETTSSITSKIESYDTFQAANNKPEAKLKESISITSKDGKEVSRIEKINTYSDTGYLKESRNLFIKIINGKAHVKTKVTKSNSRKLKASTTRPCLTNIGAQHAPLDLEVIKL